jgi:glycosyltransferase involved in cell wall biosynthesis
MAIGPLARLMQWSSFPGLVISAVSERVVSELQGALPGMRVRLLPNGADAQFWGAPRQPPMDRIVVVSAMRLNRRKRPLALVQALARAQPMVAPRRLSLRIAGEGPERRRLETYISSHAINDVALLGLQSREALRELYARAHFFVSPTTQEAFGIAALEARLAGLPVIAMRSAGCADFLLGAETPQMLATDDADLGCQIARLSCDDALRDRLSGFDPHLLRFSWRSVVGAHLAVYDEALAARRAGEGSARSCVRRHAAT